MAVTIATSGGAQGYLAVSSDGVTWRYYSGPIGSVSGNALTLSLQSTQAAAQAMAVNLPLDGRWDLPAIEECRFIRLYHRSITGSSYTLREYYPRRLVQSDDIEAESIKAINISAGAITADKISVGSLSAITASMGSLTMDGPIDITTGSIIGGGGVVTLNSTGLGITAPSGAVSTSAAYKIVDGANITGQLNGYFTAGNYYTFVETPSNTGTNASITVKATVPTTKLATTVLAALAPGKNAVITLTARDSAALSKVDIQADTTEVQNGLNVGTVSGGLNLGTGTGAGAGQISASGSAGFGVAAQSNVRLIVRGQDATSSNYAFFVQDSAAATLLSVRDDGAVAIAKSGAALGFFGSSGSTKPTVTGSRATDAWRTSLMTALANLGLLVDSSSA